MFLTFTAFIQQSAIIQLLFEDNCIAQNTTNYLPFDYILIKM